MTTATAAPAADTPSENGSVLEGATPDAEKIGTESLLTGQDDSEEMDSTEVEDAMMAGFARASGKQVNDLKQDNDDADTESKKLEGKADAVTDKQDDASATIDKTPLPEDPEVAGLGMKASEVKARLGKLETLEKTMASANGHIGHLKQLIQQAGKGKAITKESLSKVREEFGDDYAEALAADLTAAGIGGGAMVDEETLGRIVTERTAADREELERKFETKLVRRAHPDAGDYFNGGKHNSEFVTFIGTLPKERQEELADTWDSEVINRALDEFKTQKAKVVDQQTKQTRRVERSVTPTASRGSPLAPPSGDPLEAGWNNVRGRGRGNSRVGAAR